MIDKTATLITDPKLRKERRDLVRDKVLRFLRDETWSNVDVLRTVCEVTTRQGAHSILSKMERDGLIKGVKLAITEKFKINIYGITAHGLAMSYGLDEKFEDRPIFDPTRLALSRVPHQIDLQHVRLRAEAAGWRDWTRGERLGFQVKSRPDAIAVSPQGFKVALEVERTIKQRRRYQIIFNSHLAEIYKDKWQIVAYLGTAEVIGRVKNIFDALEYTIKGGQEVRISDTERERFKFFDISSEWEREL